MALSFAHGAVQWLSADAATTIYTVSGLSFQPKAIRFYWQGLGSSTDTTSVTTHIRRGFSFTTGTSAQRATVTLEEDAVATSVAVSAFCDDCIAATITSAPAIDGKLALNSITATGFTLIVNDAAPVNITVFWEAWGGDEITVNVVGDITEPAATGTQDYTATGFSASDSDDQVVFFIGLQVTSLNTAERVSSVIGLGWATGPAVAEQCIISDGADDAAATMHTYGFAYDGECLSNQTARAALSQFNADGFQLNWVTRSITGRRFAFLAIKGGKWRAGSYTIDAQTLNATATVSGLPFAPSGVTLMTRHDAENTSGVTSEHGAMSLGSGSDTSSRRTMGFFSQDNVADANIVMGIQYDQILGTYDFDLTDYEAYDLDAVTSDGFRVINEIAQGAESAVEWHGYLAFGSAPATPLRLVRFY